MAVRFASVRVPAPSGEKGVKGLITGAALLLVTLVTPAFAQDAPPRAAPTVHIQSGQLPVLDATPGLDVERATAGYLAQVKGEARDRPTPMSMAAIGWACSIFSMALPSPASCWASAFRRNCATGPRSARIRAAA